MAYSHPSSAATVHSQTPGTRRVAPADVGARTLSFDPTSAGAAALAVTRVVRVPPSRGAEVEEGSASRASSDAQAVVINSVDAQAHEDLAVHLATLPPPLDPAYAEGLHEATRQAPWFLSRLAQVMYSTPGSFCRGMGGKRLYPHQLVAHLHFRRVAQAIAEAEDQGTLAAHQQSVPRGYLEYHATGTGKTAMQATIVDACDDLFRLYGWSIYFVTTPENRDDNGIHKLHEWAQVCPLGAREEGLGASEGAEDVPPVDVGASRPQAKILLG